MLTLISPAKTLDYDSPVKLKDHTQPQFLEDSDLLIEKLRPMSAKRVSKLMNLSDKLAKLNVERYARWQLDTNNLTDTELRQSILAFKGDVYIGLDAHSLSKRDLNHAQKTLRILSGLYGLLRPFDLMQPYRLEMGTDLKNQRGKNLYEFWGDQITEVINEQVKEIRGNTVVNLASKEYFGAVKPGKLDAQLISPVFLDQKNGEYKIISFFAKKARGSMARYIIQERIKTAKALTGFDRDGYRFDSARSTKTEPVFIRDELAT